MPVTIATRVPCPGGCGAEAWTDSEPVTITRDGETRTVRIARCLGSCTVPVRQRYGPPKDEPKTFEVPVDVTPTEPRPSEPYFDPPPSAKPIKRPPPKTWTPGPPIHNEETMQKLDDKRARISEARDRINKAVALAGISIKTLSKQMGILHHGPLYDFLLHGKGCREDRLSKLLAWAENVEEVHAKPEEPDLILINGEAEEDMAAAIASMEPCAEVDCAPLLPEALANRLERLVSPNLSALVFETWAAEKLAYQMETLGLRLPEGLRFRVTVERV